MTDGMCSEANANIERPASYWKQTLYIGLLVVAGVFLKIVVDRAIYKIEEKAGSALNSLIFSPKKYDRSSNYQNSGSSYQNQGNLFGGSSNNYSSGYMNNNPFR